MEYLVKDIFSEENYVIEARMGGSGRGYIITLRWDNFYIDLANPEQLGKAYAVPFFTNTACVRQKFKLIFGELDWYETSLGQSGKS